MKNKKGFTLTEILLVIVIIGIILAIAIPTAILITKSIKQRAYDSKMDSILIAAELYGKNNQDFFGESTTIQIKVETLLAYGYIDEDALCERTLGCILDPRDDSVMNDNPITIKIKKSVVQAFEGPMVVQLSLNFNSNGATTVGAGAVGCETLNGSTCEVTLPTITRSGYIILGWNKVASGTTATYLPGQTIDIYENATYYAITSKNIEATFDKNTAASISVTSANCNLYNTQTTCSITTPAITPNSGYSTIGWNENSAATTKQYDASQSIAISANNTYYAITKLITYTCYKAVVSTTCTYTSTDLAISACQSAGYTNCVANGCASSLWTYHYGFAIINDSITEERTYDCIVQGRTSINLSLTCSSGNIRELLLLGNDGIQDLDYHYCIGEATGIQRTLYYSSTSSGALNLSESSIISCGSTWARAESGYTKWDYAADSYLYGQTSCPDGYTSTLE